ncbi:MAG: ABC transporter ATP-binding protein [Hyphomicrobium sp.]
MIAFENVTKSYRIRDSRKYVLRDFSAVLPKRNIGILGPNGAGKSTLLRLIAGSVTADSGSIRRQGRISWPLGFSGAFNGTLSGAENVRFIARIFGEDTERVSAFVEEFSELGSFYMMPVASYSSGMRARFAFGVSMAIAFDWYLVDEITAVGDQRFRRKCLETFRNRLTHSSIIMVSHSMRTIRDYCQIGGVLENGSLSLFDSLEEAIERYRQISGEVAA